MPAFTSFDGASIFYRDEGRGMPVLLLHAFPLSSEQYAPQLAALSSKYRIIAPDHRGFGASGLAGKGPSEMSVLARDAIALLNHLEISRAVIGGVSMGGYATMALLRENSSRARAIVLIDTTMAADDEAGKARREETARNAEARGMSVLVEAFLPRLIAASATPEVRASVEAMIRANKPEGAAAALRGMALRSESRDVLRAYTGPALVVVGDADVITPFEKAKEMADQLAAGKLVRISGAGHLSNLEAPAEVNRALETFLADVERS